MNRFLSYIKLYYCLVAYNMISELDKRNLER